MVRECKEIIVFSETQLMQLPPKIQSSTKKLIISIIFNSTSKRNNIFNLADTFIDKMEAVLKKKTVKNLYFTFDAREKIIILGCFINSKPEVFTLSLMSDSKKYKDTDCVQIFKLVRKIKPKLFNLTFLLGCGLSGFMFKLIEEIKNTDLELSFFKLDVEIKKNVDLYGVNSFAWLDGLIKFKSVELDMDIDVIPKSFTLKLIYTNIKNLSFILRENLFLVINIIFKSTSKICTFLFQKRESVTSLMPLFLLAKKRILNTNRPRKALKRIELKLHLNCNQIFSFKRMSHNIATKIPLQCEELMHLKKIKRLAFINHN